MSTGGWVPFDRAWTNAAARNTTARQVLSDVVTTPVLSTDTLVTDTADIDVWVLSPGQADAVLTQSGTGAAVWRTSVTSSTTGLLSTVVLDAAQTYTLTAEQSGSCILLKALTGHDPGIVVVLPSAPPVGTFYYFCCESQSEASNNRIQCDGAPLILDLLQVASSMVYEHLEIPPPAAFAFATTNIPNAFSLVFQDGAWRSLHRGIMIHP